MEHDEPGRLPILISYACFARPQVGTRAPERLRLTVQGRQTWGYWDDTNCGENVGMGTC